MENDNVTQHQIYCDECKDFNKEAIMLKAYRQAYNNDFRNLLKEEWQITSSTIKRIDRIEIILSWLIGIQIIEIGSILILIIKIFTK
jgi:hypothetical protein